ncbi:MAG: hypothetical protein ACP5NA_03350 [Candidatus Acidulodesulfobacterium sp.]
MHKSMTERPIKYFLFFAAAVSVFLISVSFYVIPPAECSAFSASVLNGHPSAVKKSKKKKYYTEGKMYIILKISKNLKAYINKKNQKVYYFYKKKYYYWANGIWFEAAKINGMYSITPQNGIPHPLKHGPLLRVKRKKIPAGFAALKVPPRPVKKGLPNAATEHLYNLPLTLHGLVIYQKSLNFNKIK